MTHLWHVLRVAPYRRHSPITGIQWPRGAMEPAPAHQPRPLVINPTKCRYEIPNKRRQCSRQPTRGTAFCGNHAHLLHSPSSTPSARGPGTAVPLEGRGSGQGQECADARGDRRRIPCPIDPAHTVSRRATRDSCHTRHTSLPHVPPMDHISPNLSPHLRDHRSSSLAPPSSPSSVVVP